MRVMLYDFRSAYTILKPIQTSGTNEPGRDLEV